jgi:hypothetical protein
MKPGTAKAKGRDTENDCVNFLLQWWPDAERKRLKGEKDEGDVTGIGYRVIEVKSGGVLAVPQWFRELKAERENLRERVALVPELVPLPPGMIAVRPSGKPNPEDWWAMLPLRDLCELWATDL